MELQAGKTIRLSLDPAHAECGTAERIYVDYKNMTKVLDVGGIIFVDDGLMSLRVEKKGRIISLIFFNLIFTWTFAIVSTCTILCFVPSRVFYDPQPAQPHPPVFSREEKKKEREKKTKKQLRLISVESQVSVYV